MSATPSLQPLTRERHAALGWQRFADYGFARGTALAPLAAPEVTVAALSLPLAFFRQGENWQLGAVLGLLPGRNLFVAPDGRWIGPYVPAMLRSHPFRAVRDAAGGQFVLCVDEASGLVTQGGGERFFDEAGQLGPATAGIWSFLLEVGKGEAQLAAACGLIAREDLLEPWPITVKDGEAARSVEGLFRVAEGRLGAISDEAFLALRRAGVLPLAYAQMLSTGNLAKLGELSEARARADAAAAVEAERRRAATEQLAPGGGFAFGQSIDVDWSKFGG